MDRFRRLLEAPWAVYLTLGLVAVATYFLLPWNSAPQLALYDAIGVSSAVAICLGALRNRPARRVPWLLFAGGQWVFLMDGLVRGPGSPLAKAVALSYPAMDIVLLSALAVFFLTPAWRAVAYRYLVASLVLLLVADEIYGTSPETYANTTPLDACWLMAYVLWGVAALHPSMTALSRPGAGRRLRLGVPRFALLACGLLTAPAVLLIERATG